MDEIDERVNGPWMVKGVPIAAAKRAVAADRLRTGPWLAAAIEAYLASGQQPHRGALDRAGPMKPWTVKGVSPASRDALTAAARRSRMNVAEWLAAVVAYQYDRGQVPMVQPELRDLKNKRDLNKILEMCDDLLRLAADIRGECRRKIADYDASS